MPRRRQSSQFEDLVRRLGLEGGVNTFIPKGRRFYYVKFRLRLPGGATRQVYQSCETADLTAAKLRAAEIFVKASAVARGLSLVPNAPENSQKMPEGASVSSVQPSSDVTIDRIIELYQAWMSCAVPGEARPRQSSAVNYLKRLQQLCRTLKVDTVGGLREAVKGLRPEAIRVSEGNFVPLLRNAAAVFGKRPMAFYAEHGVVFTSPLRSGPPVRIRAFSSPPSQEQILTLAEAAERELKEQLPRDFLAFWMMLVAGLRTQEAAHVRWKDIDAQGIWVRKEAGRCSVLPERERYAPKTVDRPVPVDPSDLKPLEEFRGLPLNFVIEDLGGPGKIKGYVPKKRALRVFVRLSKWLRAQLPGLMDGVENPNHWLRKVYGSAVARERGLQTAGEYLGHARGSVVTAQTYVALLERPTVQIIRRLPAT